VKKDLTDITLIVDRSGSMHSIAEEARGSIKRLVEEQKKVPGECNFSLVLFDDRIERPFTAIPLAQVGDIPLEPRGMTSLLDAIGSTVKKTGLRFLAMPDDQRPERVVVVIVTDGQENNSKEYSVDQVKKMVQHQRAIYKWQFIFLAADESAITTGIGFGLNVGSSARYVPTPQGIAAAYQVASKNITNYRGGAIASTDFTAEDRDQILKQKLNKGTTS